MKIVHINTNPTGGAGIAAIRLHLAMLSQGLDSHIVFLKKIPNGIPNTYAYRDYEGKLSFLFKDLFTRILTWVLSKSNQYAPISIAWTLFDIMKIPIVKEADIIHFHWVSKFLDYSFFNRYTKSVVWTLHDMAPFSGGNHYTYNYSNIDKSDVLKFNLSYKKKQLKNFNALRIVAPTKWLLELSSSSVLFSRYTHSHIRNTIELAKFHRKNRVQLREQYGYALSDKLILYIAENIQDNRKGLSYFIDIMPFLLKNNYKVIVIGNGKLSIENDSIYIAGSISNELTLMEYYSMADVFVITSLEDNFPNTILESMACGTPVVAFNNSGLNEFIEHKRTGYIAKNKNIADLEQGVMYCIKIMNRFQENQEKK